MIKYIDVERLKAEIERLYDGEAPKHDQQCDFDDGYFTGIGAISKLIDSLQQEQPEENNLPSKRTRVNYAICKLQSFKPLREAIVLDDYVYDEGKCYRENLLNYIHAIPENRLKEIRHYLQENGWWPYDDDADWMEQEQPEVDLEEERETSYYDDMIAIARRCCRLGLNARNEE